MTKNEIAKKVLASGNFQWKPYAETYGLFGKNVTETHKNVIEHLESSEMLNNFFEVSCYDEAMEWYHELEQRR